MQTKLADTEQPVRKLQQQLEEEANLSKIAELKLQEQLAEEANKAKALRHQLHKMEAELADTVRNREQLAAQLQKEVSIKVGEKINEDIRLAQEVQRRTSMAQRVVKRMLKGSLYVLFLHIYEVVEHERFEHVNILFVRTRDPFCDIINTDI